MIETRQTIAIAAPIEGVWEYVAHIPNWAGFMPGLQDFSITDADTSRWALKVGVGGMLRQVKVQVHVDQWAGPQLATFSYQLEGDPVLGGGSYAAARNSGGGTDITLTVRVEGSGPMAPMWEAMGRPLLPGFVKAFAEQLQKQIEGGAADSDPPKAARAKASLIASLWRWLQSCLRRAFQRP